MPRCFNTRCASLSRNFTTLCRTFRSWTRFSRTRSRHCRPSASRWAAVANVDASWSLCSRNRSGFTARIARTRTVCRRMASSSCIASSSARWTTLSCSSMRSARIGTTRSVLTATIIRRFPTWSRTRMPHALTVRIPHALTRLSQTASRNALNVRQVCSSWTAPHRLNTE